MANVLIAGDNYVDATFYTVALSGGSWRPALPLANLRDAQLAVVARSTDADPASTQFDIDLGVLRMVTGLAIPFTNATRLPQYRILSSNIPGDYSTPESDTGALDVYPIIYPFGTLPYGHPSWWDGRMSPEQAAVTRMPIIQVFTAPVLARYWRVEIIDAANPDGYVDVPRLLIFGGWQPGLNASLGSEIGVDSLTASVTAKSGAEFFDPQAKRRWIKFVWEYLPEAEAMSNAFDLMTVAGTDRQVFVAWDPDDTVHRHRRSFIGTLKQLGSIQATASGRFAASFVIKEALP